MSADDSTPTIPETALVRRPRDPRGHGPLPSSEIQELWFASRRTPWRTLALVPAQNGQSLLPLANALASIGRFHWGDALKVISAEGMGLAEIAELTVGSLGDPSAGQQGRILVLEPISVNPFGTAIAMACDAAILCVELGVALQEEARQTLEQIGPERFIGAAILKAEYWV